MIELFAAFGIGFGWGYFAHLFSTRRNRPLRMVKMAVISPGMPALDAILTEEWKTRMQAFTLYAEWSGLSERGMVKAGVCSERGYRRYVGVLKDAGILVAYERSRTHYAPNWCPAKVRSFIRRGKLSLPYPYQPPPAIYPPDQGDRRCRR